MPQTVTWLPSGATGTLTFSNGNRTATAGGSATPYASPQTCISTTSRITGRFSFEITFPAITQDCAVGLASPAQDFATLLGDGPAGIGYYPSTGTGSQAAQTVYLNAVAVLTPAGAPAADVAGATLSLCVNLSGGGAGTLWVSGPAMRAFYGAAAWNDSATASPGGNTGGIAFTVTGGALSICFNTAEAGGIAVLNAGSSPFVFAGIPASFPPWSGVDAVPTAVVSLTSGTLWFPPIDCPAGTALQVEAWGGGAGASAFTGGNYGAAGAGGAYAATPAYLVTPNDAANGVPYVLGNGGAGTAGVNPLNGGATSWSNGNLNLLANANMSGAVIGPANGGTPVPDAGGFFYYTPDTGLSVAIAGFGQTGGLGYTDVRVAGTVTGSTGIQFIFAYQSPAAPGQVLSLSLYGALIAGSLANVSLTELYLSFFSSTAAFLGGASVPFTYAVPLTRSSCSNATAPAGTASVSAQMMLMYATGAALNLTFRLCAPQLELGSVTPFKSSPGYTRAPGGGAPNGTTGGAGTLTGAVYGGLAYAGGNGASYNSAGAGGGGSAGPGGAGGAGTTTGLGGIGGNDTAGGTVSATSPGHPGTSAPDAGGGGGGLTVAGTGGAGGIPGGGGGAAAAGGLGGAGGQGTLRLTYARAAWPYNPQAGLAPFMAS